MKFASYLVHGTCLAAWLVMDGSTDLPLAIAIRRHERRYSHFVHSTHAMTITYLSFNYSTRARSTKPSMLATVTRNVRQCRGRSSTRARPSYACGHVLRTSYAPKQRGSEAVLRQLRSRSLARHQLQTLAGLGPPMGLPTTFIQLQCNPLLSALSCHEPAAEGPAAPRPAACSLGRDDHRQGCGVARPAH